MRNSVFIASSKLNDGPRRICSRARTGSSATSVRIVAAHAFAKSPSYGIERSRIAATLSAPKQRAMSARWASRVPDGVERGTFESALHRLAGYERLLRRGMDAERTAWVASPRPRASATRIRSPVSAM